MSTDELLQDLQDVFDAWKAEIVRQIEAVIPGEVGTVITQKVGGYSFEAMLSLLVDELSTHATNPYAHAFSLSSIGGMVSFEFDALSEAYYRAVGLPFTKVPLITPTAFGDVIRFPAASVMYLGKWISLPIAEMSVSAVESGYVVLHIAGTDAARTAGYEISADGQESLNRIVIGRFSKSGFGIVYSPREVNRLGAYAVEDDPCGMAIPAAVGGVLFDGAVAEGWFEQPYRLPETALYDKTSEPLIDSSGELLLYGVS